MLRTPRLGLVVAAPLLALVVSTTVALLPTSAAADTAVAPTATSVERSGSLTTSRQLTPGRRTREVPRHTWRIATPKVQTAPAPAPATETLPEVELDVQPAALTLAELDALLAKLAADGVTTVSTAVNWAHVRPAPDAGYDWARLDDLVTRAKSKGLKVRLRLATTPVWVHPERVVGVPAADAIWYPAGGDDLRLWGGFVADVVSRFGGSVTHVELWNEPNETWFFKPSPDPARFAALLRTGFLAAKSVRPELPVISGGLSRNDVGFLEKTYAALAGYPDAKASGFFFDVLGVHPYSGDRSPDLVEAGRTYQSAFGTMNEDFTGLALLRRTMLAAGDTAKPMWIGEYGFSTTGTQWAAPVPDERRALFLLRAFDRLDGLGVAGFGWYHSHPTPWDTPAYDVLGAGMVETATYKALRQVTGASPRLVLPAPAVAGSTVNGVLTVPAPTVPELLRAELWADGRLVASGTSTLSWDTSGRTGSTTLVLAAYARDGRTWSSTPVNVSLAR